MLQSDVLTPGNGVVASSKHSHNDQKPPLEPYIMSDNLNMDMNISSTMEDSSHEHVCIFQDSDRKKDSEVDSTSKDREKTEEIEAVNIPQDFEKRENVKLFVTSENIVEAAIEDVSTFEDIPQDLEKVSETKVVNTPFQDLEIKENMKAVVTSQDIDVNIVEAATGNTEVGSTSQNLEEKEEPEAVITLQDSEDSFSEGSIHIRVSEPFSLDDELQLYMSESNSEKETENVDPLVEQNKKMSDQEEKISGELNPIIHDVPGQGTHVSNFKNSDKPESLISLVKPCSDISTYLELKDKSFSKLEQGADTNKHLNIHQPKRRGRPPKIKNKSTNTFEKSKAEVNTKAYYAAEEEPSSSTGHEFKRNTVNVEINKPLSIHQSKRRGRPSKIKNQATNSFDKSISDIKSKACFATEEGTSSSTVYECKKNTVNILSHKNMVNQTFAMVKSGKYSKPQQKSLDNEENVVINDTLKDSSKDESEKVEICDRSISDISNVNGISRLNRDVTSNIELGEPSSNCHTVEITAIPNRETLNTQGSQDDTNSEQRNTDGNKTSKNNSEDCKSQLNMANSSSKSHSITVMSPRELISLTLEKLTNRKTPQAKEKTPQAKEKTPQAKEKTPVQKDDLKSSCEVIPLTKQRPSVEECNITTEQLIEKNKKEEIKRELIQLTLAKLTSQMPSKNRLNKSSKPKISCEDGKTFDLYTGPCTRNSKKLEVPIAEPHKLRAVSPRESKSSVKTFIPPKQRQNIKVTSARGTLSKITPIEKCKDEEGSHEAVPTHEDNFEVKTQTAKPQNKSCMGKMQIDEQSSETITMSKTLSNLNRKITQLKTIALEGKDTISSTSEIVSSNEGKNIVASQKPKSFKSVLLPEEKCVKNQLNEKNNQLYSPSSVVTDIKLDLMRGQHPKPKQQNSKEKKLKRTGLSKRNYLRFVKKKQVKPVQNKVFCKKGGLKSHKQEVAPLNKKCKRKVQIVKNKNSPSLKTVEARKSSSMDGKISKSDETVPQEQTGCINSKLVPLKEKLINKPQIMTYYPRVCLVDCKKIGLLSSNVESVSKNKPQEKNLNLNSVPYVPSQTNNHTVVDSGEYFTQLELSPSSKPRIFNNVHVNSLSTSPTEKKSIVEKVTQIDEVINIDDHDYGENCSASSPDHNLIGHKKCSNGSSLKSVPVEGITTKKCLSDFILNRKKNDSVPIKEPLPTKKIISSFPLSTQFSNHNSNHAIHIQLPCVNLSQSILETGNFLTPNSVQKYNSVSTKTASLPIRDSSHNTRSKTSSCSNSIKYSSSNIVQGSIPSHSQMKYISPHKPAEIPNMWNDHTPSNSYRVKPDQSLKLQQNVPLSALPPQKLPVASGSKNYYFTPLFVLDGDKVVPLNASNASNYSITTPSSELETANKSLKSMVTKTSESQILIDSKTITPLPVIDLEALSGSLATSSSIPSPKMDLLSMNSSSSSMNKVFPSSLQVLSSITVPSTKPTRKRKQFPSNGARTQNESHWDIAHGSSSTNISFKSDHSGATKRIKYQTHQENNYISTIQSSTKNSEPTTKQRIHTSRETLDDREHYKTVSSMSLRKDYDEPTSPKRRKYQEHQSTNHERVQLSERLSEVSSSNCHELDSFSGNESSSRSEISISVPQIQNKQASSQTNVNNQPKRMKENLSVLNSNKTMAVSKYKIKQSGSPKQANQQEQVNNDKDSPKNGNEHIKRIKENVCTLNGNSSVTQEEIPVSLSENLIELSDITKNTKVTSEGRECLKKVKKHVKSKEEELEECLDGVPPFIQEVFKCENIRDGFDNRDLIFLLSLLPDIEEMTSTQKVIFQLKAINILKDVFANSKLQSVR